MDNYKFIFTGYFAGTGVELKLMAMFLSFIEVLPSE